MSDRSLSLILLHEVRIVRRANIGGFPTEDFVVPWSKARDGESSTLIGIYREAEIHAAAIDWNEDHRDSLYRLRFYIRDGPINLCRSRTNRDMEWCDTRCREVVKLAEDVGAAVIDALDVKTGGRAIHLQAEFSFPQTDIK